MCVPFECRLVVVRELGGAALRVKRVRWPLFPGETEAWYHLRGSLDLSVWIPPPQEASWQVFASESPL